MFKLQGPDFADFDLTREGFFDLVSQNCGKPETHAAIRTDMTGNGDEFMRNPQFLKDLFRPQCVMDGIE